MKRKTTTHLVVALLVLGNSLRLYGAEDPAELAFLNKQYLEASRAAQDPIDEKFLAALDSLHKKYTGEKRLEDAQAVEKVIRSTEARRAASMPKPTEPDVSTEIPPGTVVLRGDSAVLQGSLKLTDGVVENWVRTNCLATWHSRNVPTGKYDVYFVYDAAADMGGVVELADFSYKFNVQIAPTTNEASLVKDKNPQPNSGGVARPPKLTSNPDRVLTFKRAKVGTIETRGGIGMKVSAHSVSEAGIMNLREIQLVPTP